MQIEAFVVGAFQENTYIVWDEGTQKALIIDPGGENRRILDFIEKKALQVEAIVNTHGHIDHIAGVKELQENLKIPFKLHPADVPLVEQADEAARYFGLSAVGVPVIDGVLSEDTPIQLGETTITILNTPGHSPGGVCFLAGEDVIVGDTLFAMSIGRTDLPGGSYPQLIDSIRKKLLTLDDSVAVHPGHGPSTTIGHERRTNPFLA